MHSNLHIDNRFKIWLAGCSASHSANRVMRRNRKKQRGRTGWEVQRSHGGTLGMRGVQLRDLFRQGPLLPRAHLKASAKLKHIHANKTNFIVWNLQCCKSSIVVQPSICTHRITHTSSNSPFGRIFGQKAGVKIGVRISAFWSKKHLRSENCAFRCGGAGRLLRSPAAAPSGGAG